MNNIEINDKLETDIENKYIKYKENVKFTTEEAIYILKRKDFCDEVENIAIENLIQENKELKEHLQKYYNGELFTAKQLKSIEENQKKYFIHISKLKEKIEEYHHKDFIKVQVCHQHDNEARIKEEALKELLEEGE